MTELEYRTMIAKCTDIDGLVCHKKPQVNERGSTGNGLLYTSLHMICLKKNGWLKEEDKENFLKVLKSCECGEPMLYHRSPVSTTLNSHDDYSGIAAAFFECDMIFHARRLLNECQKRNWILDNEQPYSPRFPKAWLGRMIPFTCHIYNCAKAESPAYMKMFLDLSLRSTAIFSSKSSDDAWLLAYLKSLAYKAKSSDYFMKKLKERFSDGGQGIVSRVLDEDLVHPLGVFFKLL